MAPICSGLNLLAFVALKVLSNNHLHLLVILVCFVVSKHSSFGLSIFGLVVCLDFKVLFHGFSSARVH